MEEVTLTNFEEFECRANVLLTDHKEKHGETESKPVLFRGQGKASWELKTTLERYLNKLYSPEEYYRIMLAVRPEFESCTEKHWDFSDKYTHNEAIPNAPQGYDFMVYLRHHGFPSPLLDWTRSFYIASFFAFQHAQADENVAIYSFDEFYEGCKSGYADEATIVGCGPYVKTHKRHFSQQGEYTFCRGPSPSPDKKYVYCSHEEAFKRNDNTQDVLVKFIVPITERTKVLKKLQMMNITAYTLFGSEESLLETIAYQKIK